MAQNFDKVWQQQTSNQAAINRARATMRLMGRALPCKVTAVNGSIVTVSFEVNAAPWTLSPVTIPKAESNWIRMPTQVGDTGITVASDAYLEAIAGMGAGTPELRPPGGLSGLLFLPVSNKGAPPVDQNAAQIQGPNGAIIQTTTGTTSSIVTNKNGTTVTYGNNTIVINNSEISLTAGGKTLTINSSGITLDGILWETHYHAGVTTGSGNSGPPA